MGAVTPLRSRRPDRQEARPRALRIGVVHAGRIVEEHLVPQGRPVSVGAHARSTILLPGEDQSERTDLFVLRGGRLHLKLLAGARGKLSDAGAVRTLDALALDPRTVRRGRELLFPLPDDARGKVQVRDYTLLFQLVDPPPQPASSRAGVHWTWRDVDWVFMVLVAISALLHAAAMAWIESQPPPTRVELRELVHHHVAFQIPPAPVADVPPEPITQDAPEASEDPTVDNGNPVPTPATDTPDPDDTNAPASGQAGDADPFEGTFLDLIGTAMQDDRSAVREILMDPSGYDDVAEALAAGVVRIGRERRGPGLKGPDTIGDDVASIGDLGPAGDCADCPPRPTTRPTKKKKAPEPTITQDPIPGPPSDGAFDIARELKRLHPRFKACYEKQLKLDGDLSGRVSLTFSTNSAARVVDVDFETNATGNAALAGCLEKTLRRYPFPPDAADMDVGPYTLYFSPQ